MKKGVPSFEGKTIDYFKEVDIIMKKGVPSFDENGNIPPGCYICNVHEFKDKFVTSFPESTSRKSRFKCFIDYSKHICENIHKTNRFIINGSYTTTKNNPNDIDLLIVFNLSQMTKNEHEFVEKECKMQSKLDQQHHIAIELSKRGLIDINNVYCCDWYPLYQRDPDDEKYEDYLKDKKFWLNFLGSSRKNENGIRHPKGLVAFDLELDLLEGLDDSF